MAKKVKREQIHTIKMLLKYIEKYSILVALLLLIAVITVVTTLYIPILTGQALDQMIDDKHVYMEGILRILTYIALVITITSLSQWIMNKLNNKITYQVVRDLRNDAFKKIEILPLDYIDSHSHGDIVSKVIADVDQLADGILMGFTQLFTGIITIIGTLGFMIMTNIGITAVVVLVTPISFFVAGYIAKKTYFMFSLQSQIRAEQTGLIDEMIENQKVVQAFSQEENVSEKFDEINGRLESASVNAIFYSSITNPVTRFINGLVYAGVGAVGSFLALNGRITIGQLTCFLNYANQYTKPFNEISGVLTELQNALACAQRILDLIDEEPQVPECEDAISLKNPRGDVTLTDVFFSYKRDIKLIEDFNLHVSKGQKVAVVGPTGCGKTTIINLLMRFYDINSGSIKVEEIDIKAMTRQSLRENYGMVLQETWLKSGTIEHNLKMGYPKATEEEMIDAAKKAHAHNFIMKLKDGYQTKISEDGSGLSTGEKQLLCIARVMLCLPPMLIFDEATSSIDTRTEIKIQEAFSKMMEGRTSFIVAHRLSTVQEADIILFMRDGKIMEQGSHDALLAKQGEYASLYQSQFIL